MRLKKVENNNGVDLVYDQDSGLNLIKQDKLFFKDNDRTGKLKPFEDWRLSPKKRAVDLAKRLSIKDIAGLMLFTSHLTVPSVGDRGQMYHGKPYSKSNCQPSDLSDLQKKYFLDERIKHTLVTAVESASTMAKWNNKVQALSESMSWSIPIVNSTDPRHGYNADTEFNEANGGDVSQWPEQIGLGATFDPKIVQEFGNIAAKEDRAMGISMFLGPQVDVATEPRWMRLNGTFGESARLTSAMASAEIKGMQTSDELNDWGHESISTIAKHWPGGGVIEGGRDAHFGYGKYGVYPRNNQQYQLKTFESVIDKDKPNVEKTSGIMPYYSVSTNFSATSENVGNSYSHYLITDLLRKKYQYDEVVCTDWCITADEPTNILDVLSGDQCWGVEDNYTIGERHLKLLLAGVDQFGGNKDPKPIVWAYKEMCKLFGKQIAEARFRLSAMRILKNMFRLGLFENPYTDPQNAESVVGNSQYVDAGLTAQKKSIVLLKNKKRLLPLAKKTKVYIPKRFYPATHSWYLHTLEAFTKTPFNLGIVGQAFDVTDNPDEADVALVGIKAPERDLYDGNGYSTKLAATGDNGYLPVTLQYKPYTAKDARPVSLAGDNRPGKTLNRTYRNKTVRTLNEDDLKLVMKTKEQMKDKPIIVSVTATNPMVFSEVEPYADVVLFNFGVSDKAITAVLCGDFEPSGLLPVQLPRDMSTVEAQSEDTPFDMIPYVDEMGHSYDFGYGLNYSGVIKDWRTRKFIKDEI